MELQALYNHHNRLPGHELELQYEYQHLHRGIAGSGAEASRSHGGVQEVLFGRDVGANWSLAGGSVLSADPSSDSLELSAHPHDAPTDHCAVPA